MTRIDLPLTITNSELGDYRRCKRRWWLKYVLMLAKYEDAGTGPMWIGIVIHGALEQWVKDKTDPVQLVKDIYEMFTSYYDDPNDRVQALRLEGLRKDRDLAVLMVEGFLQWQEEEGLQADLELIGPEQDLTVPSRIKGVSLRGKLDVRARRISDGRIVFIDWKTVGSFGKILNTIDISEQFRYYAMLQALESMQQNEGAEPQYTDGGVVVMLRRVKRTANAKPPFYAKEEIRFNKHELSSMWARTHAMIAEMLSIREQLAAGGDHRRLVYPTPSGDCDWDCDFLPVCHLMDDGSRWRQALDEQYVQHDPLARYNEDSLAERVNRMKAST
jgi:hypothetical protein